MKYIFTLLLIALYSFSFGQDILYKYYDTSWNYTTKANAAYIRELKKEGISYSSKLLYANTKTLKSKGTVTDTSAKHYIGFYQSYYENGRTVDSVEFLENDVINYSYGYNKNGARTYYSRKTGAGPEEYDTHHYYEDGKEWMHVYWNASTKKKVEIGYNQDGTKIPDFIYERVAEFEGGFAGWQEFLQKTLRGDVPGKHRAPAGKYSVMVEFLIDKEGKIKEVTTLNDPGYGTKEEAIRVMKKSPKWTPAIQFNKNVNFRARQAITFVVANE